jgi:hypothetical protein
MNLSSLVVLATLATSPASETAAVTSGPPHGYFPPAPIFVYEPPHWDCRARHRGQIDRYPTFHALHYRRAYNYRNMVDYPWHADQHRDVWGTYPPTVPMPPPATFVPHGAAGSAIEGPESMPAEPVIDERELRSAARKVQRPRK